MKQASLLSQSDEVLQAVEAPPQLESTIQLTFFSIVIAQTLLAMSQYVIPSLLTLHSNTVFSVQAEHVFGVEVLLLVLAGKLVVKEYPMTSIDINTNKSIIVCYGDRLIV
jgi:hypothetical protein